MYLHDAKSTSTLESFFERTTFLRTNKIFRKKGVVQEKKPTIDEQNGSFREIKKDTKKKFEFFPKKNFAISLKE